MKLTDYQSYADAQAHFSKQALWDLFDGDRDQLNLTHECLDRHRGKGRAVRIAYADGRDTSYTFEELSRWASRFANYLQHMGIEKGDRVAILLEPSLPFYVALFGTMKMGAVAVPMFTLFGKDALAMRLDDLVAQFGLPPPTHLKIDVDGAELDVLQGATRVLAHEGVRTLLVEIDESLADEVMSVLRDAGFSLAERHGHFGKTGAPWYGLFVRAVANETARSA